MLRYLTAGESHGKALITIIEGLPSNLQIDSSAIDRDLKRRQGGYGRGGRMKIESDHVEFLSGVRHGVTLGSPVTLFIENRDWKNWQEIMASDISSLPAGASSRREPAVTRPRPGHADLSGALKYDQKDLRNILERSSARETAVRVAAGALSKRLLLEFGIHVYSWVTEIGGASISDQSSMSGDCIAKSSLYYSRIANRACTVKECFDQAELSTVRCPDKKTSELMRKKIDAAREAGDSLGGVFEVVVSGVPVGLGSHVQYDRKLDAAIAGSVMSIQAIKGVEIGIGFEEGRRPGSEVHDEIVYKKPDFKRRTNHAGGIEGGMSNGEDIVVRAVMKPIPTLYKPLMSVDIETKEPFEASIERSDICAVPAAAVIGEAVVAIEIARAFLEKFGGDSMEEIRRNYRSYQKQVKEI